MSLNPQEECFNQNPHPRCGFYFFSFLVAIAERIPHQIETVNQAVSTFLLKWLLMPVNLKQKYNDTTTSFIFISSLLSTFFWVFPACFRGPILFVFFLFFLFQFVPVRYSHAKWLSLILICLQLLLDGCLLWFPVLKAIFFLFIFQEAKILTSIFTLILFLALIYLTVVIFLHLIETFQLKLYFSTSQLCTSQRNYFICTKIIIDQINMKWQSDMTHCDFISFPLEV